MLFLLALPVISCVALLRDYLDVYAPSNVLIRVVRSTPPRWRTAAALLTLVVVLLLGMHVVAVAIASGAPGWLNILVFVLAWDAIKFVWLLALLGSRAGARGFGRIHAWVAHNLSRTPVRGA